MHIQKILAVVLLGLSLSAAADFTTITAAYEVAVGDLFDRAVPRHTEDQDQECPAVRVGVVGEDVDRDSDILVRGGDIVGRGGSGHRSGRLDLTPEAAAEQEVGTGELSGGGLTEGALQHVARSVTRRAASTEDAGAQDVLLGKGRSRMPEGDSKEQQA